MHACEPIIAPRCRVITVKAGRGDGDENGRSDDKVVGREFRIGATLLSLYAFALVLADPEGAMWAAAMAAGALPSEIPPPLSHTPVRTVRRGRNAQHTGSGAFVHSL